MHNQSHCTQNLMLMINNTNGKIEITRLPYTRMLKSEVAELALSTIDIIESYNPELLQIKPLFDLLVAKKPAISKLNINYGVDTMRLKIKNLQEKLHLKVSFIKLHLRLIQKSTDESELIVIQNAVDSYLRYLNLTKSTVKLSHKVSGFISAIEEDTKLGLAIKHFNLTNEVNALQQVHEELNAVSAKRIEELSKRPKVNTAAIIKEVTEAIDDLYDWIELAHLANTNIDYIPVAKKLNQLTVMMRDSLNRRKAFNKRRIAAKKRAEMEGKFHQSDVYVDAIKKMDGLPIGETSLINLSGNSEGSEG